MKSRASCLGSARASRAGEDALAITNFSAEISRSFQSDGFDCGEAPQSAREVRAFPKTCRRLYRLMIAFYMATFAACETANYAPPVAPAMTSASSRRQHVDPAKLESGRTLFVHRCIECHTLPPIWKYSREDWPQIVNEMSHRASLKPAERDAVIAYILAVRSSEH